MVLDKDYFSTPAPTPETTGAATKVAASK
jgi:hypothetical protein